MSKIITNEIFKQRIQSIFGDSVDVSNCVYATAKTKIIAICPKHGEFETTPDSLMSGHGCPKCGTEITRNKLALTTEEFIRRAKLVHGDNYIYANANYVNADTKVCILCPIHGEFWQTPYHHINRKQGCPKCNCGMTSRLTVDEYIKQSTIAHNAKYDYSLVDKTSGYIDVICHNVDDNNDEHGIFKVSTYNHLYRHYGCPKCSKSKPIDTKEFIKRARKIHGNDYSYEKTHYEKSQIPIIITCPIHGDFLMLPNNHLSGKQGCPFCKKSKLVKQISNLLKNNNISFIQEQSFEWLKYKSKLFLDFYLPEYNIAIECQGEQHYRSIEHFGGEKEFEIRQIRDKIKYDLCKEHNIPIFYFAATNLVEESDILFKHENLLLEKIKGLPLV